MYLPPNKTEAEVLEAIEKAVRMLAPTFTFGYYDVDDISQEARIFGMECLPKYDTTRKLENFVFSHIRNRLINLLRNKLRRSDSPCKQCHRGEPCQPDRMMCEKYMAWFERNAAKSHIMQPLGIDHISDEQERNTKSDSTVVAEVEHKEIIELIDTKLPIELRLIYLQMKDGISVPRNKKQLVLDAIREILNDG